MNFEKQLSIFLLLFSITAPGSPAKSKNRRPRRTKMSQVNHSAPAGNGKDSDGTKMEEITEASYWCYHCASPRRYESHEMLTAMDQLLQLRGSFYPYNAVFEDCHFGRNLSVFPRQSCKYPFCHKITFNDGEGPPLTIRGCSEKFVASSEKEFCRQIHKQMDITECSCRTNGLCEKSSANTLQKAGLKTFTSIAVSGAILLLFSLYFA